MTSYDLPPKEDGTPFSPFDFLLSNDPARQAVEIAFLERLIAASATAGAEVLTRAGGGEASSFSTHIAQMQSPIFQRIARSLEKAIPSDAKFGVFRGKKQG